MTEKKPKSTPAQKLARQLKVQKTNQPELDRFRRKLRTIVPLCRYATDISEWITARYDLGLITDPAVVRISDEILRLIELVEEERFKKPQPHKPAISSEERMQMLIAREEKARAEVPPVGCIVTPSIQTRMAAGFDSILDQLIAEVRSGAPPH